ncbi:MAG: CotH kinase family protein, partial [Saprospiraceae bacterium]
LYNPSAAAVNIHGYYLSDNPDNPKKFIIPSAVLVPAGGYVLVIASGRNMVNGNSVHTNFKLSQTKNNAEHIVFSNPSGLIINDIKVEHTKLSQSWGRATDGALSWRVFTAPTPEASNNGAASAADFAKKPDLSQSAGFYAGPITVDITTEEPDALIRYTTDGTEPKAVSPLYTVPVTISATTVLKAASFSNNPDVLPSFVQYNTYFIGVSHTLPVVSVGSDGVLELANGNQPLRPKGSIEYFGKDGQRKTRGYGELNSHGQDSWANDQRSLDWVTRDEMGYSAALKEKLFSMSDRDEYQRIILRAAGDDNYPAAHHPQNEGSAHIRDAYVQNLAKKGGLHLDVRQAEKAILYLNGQYWGVYDLREVPDDHDYTDYYYGQGKYDIQYILTWGATWSQYGGGQSLEDWSQLYNFIISSDLSDSTNFQYVKDQFDYTSLVDYVVTNSFTVCSDWLNYNTGWWRGLNPAGGHRKWGYILWDNDATFDFYINYTGIPNTNADAAPCNPEILATQPWSDPEGHITILNKLRQNPEFNQYYITRQADLLHTAFSCETMLHYLDTIEGILSPEMAQHAARWDGTYAEWQENVTRLRDFIAERCVNLETGIKDCYALTGPFATVVVVDPPGAGTLQVNTLPAVPGPVSGNYFGTIGLKLVADPAAGSTYVFKNWTASHHAFTQPNAASTLLDLTAADTIVAHFQDASVATQTPDGPEAQPAVAAYPSVFDDQLTLDYFLPEKAAVEVRIYSLLGREMATLPDPETLQTAGRHQTQLDRIGQNLPSGVYFLHFRAGNFQQNIKLVRTR